MARDNRKERWDLWRAQLREAREAANLSRDELAPELGIHLNTLLAWENGDSRPDVVELMRWTDSLDGTLEMQLLGPTASDRRIGALVSSLGGTRAARALGRAARKRSA